MQGAGCKKDGAREGKEEGEGGGARLRIERRADLRAQLVDGGDMRRRRVEALHVALPARAIDARLVAAVVVDEEDHEALQPTPEFRGYGLGLIFSQPALVQPLAPIYT